MKSTETSWIVKLVQKHVYYKEFKVVAYYVVFAVFLLIFIISKIRSSTPMEVYLPHDVDFQDYEPFEPDITADFEPDVSKHSRIPKIIHQTWKDTHIPHKFVKGIKSFVENNPDWQYYLWTDESAKQFVIDHYPGLLGLWNGYAYQNDKIRIADALRYVVLYHFGGVYADMDVMNFRSLNGAIKKHDCVLMPEPYEQAILRGGVPFFINNAIMMCRPRHPFFKHLIDHLVDFEIMQTVWDSTGPGYVTFQYKTFFHLPRERGEFILYGNRTCYDKTDSSPYFFRGNMPLTDERSVYIANSQYFLVTLDREPFRRYYNWCLRFHELDEMWKRACVNMKRKGLYRELSKYTYTDHKWDFTYGANNFFYYLPLYSFIASTDIEDLVPHHKIYREDLER